MNYLPFARGICRVFPKPLLPPNTLVLARNARH